ncbi:hypothetical protein KS4_29020 [Poriferisphaera corsica]|uniref:Uncharacterized protein n=1 Tax=Poriferisphaera corsica TaxID=2528020 RepID=A0A517YX77_9BACT|nr:hypothetical protein [Poriferisphaera corsica]QDU34826.1 hypothetical protein KS4_29020 [Poriferisphaera corsica]
MCDRKKSVEQLERLAVEVFLEDDESKLAILWQDVAKKLREIDTDVMRHLQIVRDRDIDEFNDLLEQIKLPSKPEPISMGIPTALTETDLPPLAPIEEDEDEGEDEEIDWLSDVMLKQAMRAFRRRLKLKLDAATSREAEQMFAIQPPATYPQAVWEELVKRRQLLQEGKGFYRLPND